MKEEERALFDQRNDWLEEERKRESRISVWDLDDSASVLKKKHNDDCESRQIKQRHAYMHKMADLREAGIRSQNEIRRQPAAATLARIVAIFVFIMFLIIFFMVFLL